MPTPQQLVDKARHLDEECKLILSGKQQNWLEDILYDDEGEPKRPELTPAATSFLTSIWDGRYTQPNI